MADLYTVSDEVGVQTPSSVRPWGWYTVLGEPDHEPVAAVKLLWVEPGEMLSLQTHRLRRERWIPISYGLGAVIGDQEIELMRGRAYVINMGVPHRLFDMRGSGGNVIEVMYGTYDEDDIIRLNDIYDR